MQENCCHLPFYHPVSFNINTIQSLLAASPLRTFLLRNTALLTPSPASPGVHLSHLPQNIKNSNLNCSQKHNVSLRPSFPLSSFLFPSRLRSLRKALPLLPQLVLHSTLNTFQASLRRLWMSSTNVTDDLFSHCCIEGSLDVPILSSFCGFVYHPLSAWSSLISGNQRK